MFAQLRTLFVQQDDVEYSSSVSISPEQHDGYLADSEENADLSSLQTQIQQARDKAKKYQKRKEEGQERKRKESREKKAKHQQSQGQFGVLFIHKSKFMLIFLSASLYVKLCI